MTRRVPPQLKPTYSPNSTIERIKNSIRPVREKLKAKGFLPKAHAFLKEAGLTEVSTLIIDDEDVFPPKGARSGPLAAAAAAGSAFLSKRSQVGQVILVAEGRPEAYHVVLGMNFMRRHPRNQPGLLVNVSALPTSTPALKRSAKGLDWLLRETKRQADETRRKRQALVDKYTERLAQIFPGLPMRVTKKV